MDSHPVACHVRVFTIQIYFFQINCKLKKVKRDNRPKELHVQTISVTLYLEAVN